MDATIRDGFLAATHIFNGYDTTTDEYNHPFRGCPCSIDEMFTPGQDGVTSYARIAIPLAIEPYIIMNDYRGRLTPEGARELMRISEFDLEEHDGKTWFALPVNVQSELTRIKFKDKSRRALRQKEANK
jgi:hypothetical protein